MLTAIIQSSSASVGILQALCKSNPIAIGAAIPIVLGQNIGTCVTAMLSSVGAKKNATSAAWFHLLYNIFSAIIFIVLFYGLNAIFKFEFMKQNITVLGVAIFHTLFNVFKMLALAPFSDFLVKLSCILSGKDDTEEEVVDTHEVPELDVRFLDKPALAMEHCTEVATKMALAAKDTLFGP